MAKSKLPKRKKIKEKKPIVWIWKDRGWTGEIIKSEDGAGWAFTMTRDGDEAPVYMGPWTMGRNKIDPKPMSTNAFNTWIKSATEFLARSQYQVRTSDRQVFTIYTESGDQLSVSFDIERGDYESEGLLIAEDIYGNEIIRLTVDPKLEFNLEVAQAWVDSDFAPPPPPEEVAPVIDHDEVWEPDESEDEEVVEETTFVEEYVEPDYGEPVFEYD